ncbi:TNF receptor-associated factor 4-like [Halichondria panicea]|uniref:TNF receptor-associated factor 4-like n=1 Tax=Halichondria panicea TaxID=6063 RepID=UPI00312B3FBA
MASPQLSGYQSEFVESVGDYECPLCLHVTREPSLTSCCGQHFCQACIQKILTDNKPCPLCKENSFTTLLDKKQRRRVLDLKIYCDKKAKGCDWVGGLGEREQHLGEKCGLIYVRCPYNCGCCCHRRSLNTHKTNTCPKRPHICNYCNLEGTYKIIQDDHLPVCSKYPVACPNECRVAPLERGKLEGHLRECPLAMVECELKVLGCEEVVQRKDADKHMEQAAQKHLRLSTSYFIKNQKRQDKQITRLQREVNEAREQHRRLSSQIDLIKRYSPMYVTELNVNYRQDSGERWYNKTNFEFLSTGCKIMLCLYLGETGIDIELTHVESKADDQLEWPRTFSMTVTLIDQGENQDHHVFQGENLILHRNECNDTIQIPYSTIENPPDEVEYIVHDHIKMEIIVTEK